MNEINEPAQVEQSATEQVQQLTLTDLYAEIESGINSAKALNAFENLKQRIDRLIKAADAVYSEADSGTLSDLDFAQNVIATGVEDCR